MWDGGLGGFFFFGLVFNETHVAILRGEVSKRPQITLQC